MITNREALSKCLFRRESKFNGEVIFGIKKWGKWRGKWTAFDS